MNIHSFKVSDYFALIFFSVFGLMCCLCFGVPQKYIMINFNVWLWLSRSKQCSPKNLYLKKTLKSKLLLKYTTICSPKSQQIYNFFAHKFTYMSALTQFYVYTIYLNLLPLFYYILKTLHGIIIFDFFYFFFMLKITSVIMILKKYNTVINFWLFLAWSLHLRGLYHTLDPWSFCWIKYKVTLWLGLYVYVAIGQPKTIFIWDQNEMKILLSSTLSRMILSEFY